MVDEHEHALLCKKSSETPVAFIALEYIPKSQTLMKLIRTTKGLSELDTWHYFKQLMQAVRDIHGSEAKFLSDGYIGLAHCDLKPTNMMVTQERILKVIDFGLSQPIIDEETGLSIKVTGYRGTRGYMAPEIVSYSEDRLEYPGDKADLFACGVILFNMRSGKKPF